MGWANCGEDKNGRPIGYAHEATCDHPGCEEEIDRGLAYACGGMHGDNDGCEGYFCEEHRSHYLPEKLTGSSYGGSVCVECYEAAVKEHGPICPECIGDGAVGFGGKETCGLCSGTGLVTIQ